MKVRNQIREDGDLLLNNVCLFLAHHEMKIFGQVSFDKVGLKGTVFICIFLEVFVSSEVHIETIKN